jgi:hypothetical protein
MLTVEDDEFWKGAEPVVFGSLPQLQAAVTVVGYPIGGRAARGRTGVALHTAAVLLGCQVQRAPRRPQRLTPRAPSARCPRRPPQAATPCR